MSRLKSFQTLRKSSEFGYFYNNSDKRHVRTAIVFFRPGSGRRAGFTASKKIGNAVARNFAKRRMRAAFNRISDHLKEGTYIFVAKKEILHADFATVEKEMRYALKKLKAL